MEKITVCITGHDGFIGTRLISKLNEDPRWTIVPFVGDLRRPSEIEAFFQAHPKVEQIIHLAGIFFGDVETLFSVNVLGTLNLLDAASKHGLQRIINASTGAVYGEPQNGISREEDPRQPTTLYGLSKLFAEQSIEYHARTQKIETLTLRFPNVYGPGNQKGVIYQFLSSIQREKKIVIAGTGEQKRNFLYVDDAVSAILSAMDYTGSETVFNIASEELLSLNEVVGLLKSIGLAFEVEVQPADERNTLQVLSLDITKAKQFLGWTPNVSLQEGIGQLIANGL
jgi:UDP-glucose 4-epimerase